MIGDHRHAVMFENPGPAVADGDGGFTHTWTPLDPSVWWVSIAPASPQDLERFASGSVITQATNMVRGRFHPDVSTATRMWFNGRPFAVVGTRNVDERSVDMELLAVELVPAHG